jgi:hypothetical protein
MGSEANLIIRERAKVGASRTQLDNRSLAQCQEWSTWHTRQCRVVLRSAAGHEKFAAAPSSDPNCRGRRPRSPGSSRSLPRPSTQLTWAPPPATPAAARWARRRQPKSSSRTPGSLYSHLESWAVRSEHPIVLAKFQFPNEPDVPLYRSSIITQAPICWRADENRSIIRPSRQLRCNWTKLTSQGACL